MNVQEHRDDFQNFKIMENGLSISAIMANMSYSVDGEDGDVPCDTKRLSLK